MGFDSKRKADLFVVTEGPDGTAPRAAKGSPITKPSRVANQTDADRIASARARHLASVKENNLPGAPYGFGYLPEYFQDGPQPETSMYDFNRLLFTLHFLGDSKLYFENDHCGQYRNMTGIWTRKDKSEMSIQHLKDRVAARIVELGISAVLLFEYFAVPHTQQEDQQLYSLSFAEKMLRFKK